MYCIPHSSRTEFSARSIAARQSQKRENSVAGMWNEPSTAIRCTGSPDWAVKLVGQASGGLAHDSLQKEATSDYVARGRPVDGLGVGATD